MAGQSPRPLSPRRSSGSIAAACADSGDSVTRFPEHGKKRLKTIATTYKALWLHGIRIVARATPSGRCCMCVLSLYDLTRGQNPESTGRMRRTDGRTDELEAASRGGATDGAQCPSLEAEKDVRAQQKQRLRPTELSGA
jgi:hypothetical protein